METTVGSQPLFKKRGAKANNIRKRPATPPPGDGDSSSGYTSTEDEGGRSIKRRRKTAVVTASSAHNASNPASKDLSTTKYTGDRSAQITDTNDATKQSNWYDETDPKQLLGSTRTQPSRTGGDNDDDGSTYKGHSAYRSFVTRNPNAATPKAVGPMKAPTNVRTITIMDFAPDVCKDYKQTGFCGFGDNCKYLHAREDYKHGWQLDKDWEKAGNGAGRRAGGSGRRKTTDGDAAGGEEGDPDADDEAAAALLEKIPFACIICKSDYKTPIVTKCDHYFCEACALHRYRKTPTCAACGAGTNGVFNGAKNLKKLLERKTERERLKREKAAAEGAEEEGGADGAKGGGEGNGGGGNGNGNGDGGGSGKS